MKTASLVLGILSLVAAGLGGFFGAGFLGLVLGIPGIVFAVIANKKGETATAGLVCSIVGTALGALTWIACAACVGGISSLM